MRVIGRVVTHSRSSSNDEDQEVAFDLTVDVVQSIASVGAEDVGIPLTSFHLHRLLPETTTQEELFHTEISRIVNHVMEGTTSLCVVGGGLHSGKRWSVEGSRQARGSIYEDGMLYRAVEDILTSLDKSQQSSAFVSLSCVALRGAEMEDILSVEFVPPSVGSSTPSKRTLNSKILLSPRNQSLSLRDDPQEGIVVEGQVRIRIDHCNEVSDILDRCSKYSRSSRGGHIVYGIHLNQATSRNPHSKISPSASSATNVSFSSSMDVSLAHALHPGTGQRKTSLSSLYFAILASPDTVFSASKGSQGHTNPTPREVLPESALWIKYLDHILNDLEKCRPSAPFHKSKITLFLRDALLCRRPSCFICCMNPFEDSAIGVSATLAMGTRIAALVQFVGGPYSVVEGQSSQFNFSYDNSEDTDSSMNESEALLSLTSPTNQGHNSIYLSAEESRNSIQMPIPFSNDPHNPEEWGDLASMSIDEIVNRVTNTVDVLVSDSMSSSDIVRSGCNATNSSAAHESQSSRLQESSKSLPHPSKTLPVPPARMPTRPIVVRNSSPTPPSQQTKISRGVIQLRSATQGGNSSSSLELDEEEDQSNNISGSIHQTPMSPFSLLKLSTADRKIAQLSRHLQAERERVKELQKQIKEYGIYREVIDGTLARLKDQVSLMESESNDLRKQLAYEKSRTAKFQHTKSSLFKDLEDATRTVEDLQGMLQKVEGESKQECDELRARIHVMYIEDEKLRMELTTVRKERDEWKRQALDSTKRSELTRNPQLRSLSPVDTVPDSSSSPSRSLSPGFRKNPNSTETSRVSKSSVPSVEDQLIEKPPSLVDASKSTSSRFKVDTKRKVDTHESSHQSRSQTFKEPPRARKPSTEGKTVSFMPRNCVALSPSKEILRNYIATIDSMQDSSSS